VSRKQNRYAKVDEFLLYIPEMIHQIGCGKEPLMCKVFHHIVMHHQQYLFTKDLSHLHLGTQPVHGFGPDGTPRGIVIVLIAFGDKTVVIIAAGIHTHYP